MYDIIKRKAEVIAITIANRNEKNNKYSLETVSQWYEFPIDNNMKKKLSIRKVLMFD